MPLLAPQPELHAAVFQATITAGLCVLCAFLYAQYRKPYLLWWAVAWVLYLLRIGAIVGFLTTRDADWLFLHQVLTGWTALALLWAALLFSHQPRWRWRYLPAVLFPPVWSYVAIYRLRSFFIAAGPAVLFLSLATLWTGWVFFRHRRRVGSQGAALLATAFLLWGFHHLDYPLLRARGAWVPWGYYLDILFLLVTGVGILLLVTDELRRGLSTLSVLSGDLQRGDHTGDSVNDLLARPLALGGVRGSALYLGDGAGDRFVGGLGACAHWTGTRPEGVVRDMITRAVELGRPAVSREWNQGTASPAPWPGEHAYAAVLPIFHRASPAGALVIVGDERDPFAALGESFLLALGHQVGAALERADLYRHLAARSRELERLSHRTVQQHEAERRKISLELHDETAQLFSAVKLQLGLLRETADPELATRIDRVLTLVDAGIKSIRRVTSDLRPPLLDDLGLVPALRALVADFADHSGLEVVFDPPAALPLLGTEAELALFRALQEALSNVARHASAVTVVVTLRVEPDGAIVLGVRDDGRGLSHQLAERSPGHGHMGLAGMRERIGAVGGTIELRSGEERGLDLRVRVPVAEAAAS